MFCWNTVKVDGIAIVSSLSRSSCPGSSVGRVLIPRKWRVVGSNPTQGSSFFFEKKDCSGFVESHPGQLFFL